MLGVYLLEIYKEGSSVPEFGLTFLSHEILIEFVEKNVKFITPEYKRLMKTFATENPLGETQLLDEEQMLRVTYVPFINKADDTKYNQYITGSRKPTEIQILDSYYEIDPGTKDSISTQEIHNEERIVDFNGSLRAGKYIKFATFKKLDNRSVFKTDPFTRQPITKAIIYKAKIKGRAVKTRANPKFSVKARQTNYTRKYKVKK